MHKFVILLSVVACAFGAAIPEGLQPQLDGRVIGGEPTTIGKIPFQVSLQRSGHHFCGGSIYSTRYIVTAAHCVELLSASHIQIRAGSSDWNSGGVLINVEAIISHEGYNPITFVNDIALLRLESELTFSSDIGTVKLATSNPANGAPATVSGWGTQQFGTNTVPVQLRSASVFIIDLQECRSKEFGYGVTVRKGMICAGAPAKKSCQGDSGGPLVSGGKLVGIVSWGIGCDQARYPGVYSDVSILGSWVEKNAK